MYEHDYESEEMFTATTLQDALREMLTIGYDTFEIIWENLQIQTYAEAGVLSNKNGLVIRLPDGTEFQLTIVQSR